VGERIPYKKMKKNEIETKEQRTSMTSTTQKFVEKGGSTKRFGGSQIEIIVK
jgi:hypothetical protein